MGACEVAKAVATIAKQVKINCWGAGVASCIGVGRANIAAGNDRAAAQYVDFILGLASTDAAAVDQDSIWRQHAAMCGPGLLLGVVYLLVHRPSDLQHCLR